MISGRRRPAVRSARQSLARNRTPHGPGAPRSLSVTHESLLLGRRTRLGNWHTYGRKNLKVGESAPLSGRYGQSPACGHGSRFRRGQVPACGHGQSAIAITLPCTSASATFRRASWRSRQRVFLRDAQHGSGLLLLKSLQIDEAEALELARQQSDALRGLRGLTLGGKAPKGQVVRDQAPHPRAPARAAADPVLSDAVGSLHARERERWPSKASGGIRGPACWKRKRRGRLSVSPSGSRPCRRSEPGRHRSRPGSLPASGEALFTIAIHPSVMAAVIEARGLTKRYGETVAVNDVSLRGACGRALRAARPERFGQIDDDPDALRPDPAHGRDRDRARHRRRGRPGRRPAPDRDHPRAGDPAVVPDRRGVPAVRRLGPVARGGGRSRRLVVRVPRLRRQARRPLQGPLRAVRGRS